MVLAELRNYGITIFILFLIIFTDPNVFNPGIIIKAAQERKANGIVKYTNCDTKLFSLTPCTSVSKNTSIIRMSVPTTKFLTGLREARAPVR